MKTLLAINTLTSVQNQPYASHLNLVYRMGKESTDEILLLTGYRTGIDRFRNMAGEVALANECDLLMFLDDDVAVPRDTYSIMRKHIDAGSDIVTPLIYIRGYPFEPMMFKSKVLEGVTGLFPYSDWENYVSSEEPLLPCAAIGFSCALIRTSLLKSVAAPWFVTGANCTEDVYFCIKCHNATDNGVKILVDTSVRGGHLLDPEFIDFSTRPALRSFFEALRPELLDKKSGDRGEDYFKANIARIKADYEIA